MKLFKLCVVAVAVLALATAGVAMAGETLQAVK